MLDTAATDSRCRAGLSGENFLARGTYVGLAGNDFSVVLRGLDPQPRLGLDRPQVAVGRAKPSQDKIGAAISPLHRRKRFSPDLERRLDRIEDRRRQVLGIGTVVSIGGGVAAR